MYEIEDSRKPESASEEMQPVGNDDAVRFRWCTVSVDTGRTNASVNFDFTIDL